MNIGCNHLKSFNLFSQTLLDTNTGRAKFAKKGATSPASRASSPQRK
ncbi:hypothetical protein CDS [Bradyrhizobium sp.]|nr:hypothetical protein CDS [Bradyrhizobium sp.]